jgi:hypothetical protein
MQPPDAAAPTNDCARMLGGERFARPQVIRRAPRIIERNMRPRGMVSKAGDGSDRTGPPGARGAPPRTFTSLNARGPRGSSPAGLVGGKRFYSPLATPKI